MSTSNNKKAKVIMLPTNNESLNSVCCIRSDKPFLMSEQNSPFKAKIYDTKDLYHTYFNLYIISDDEIKEGDWCITGLKIIRKCKSILYSNNNFKSINGYEFEDGTKDTRSSCKKIIATTDISLTLNTYYEIEGEQKVNLPQPSQQFIEKYIESYNKGEVITDVLVEYELSYEASKIIEHHINKIPKLKVDKNNTITIKKVKDSWNREEVLNLLYDVNRGVFRYEANFDLDKFIEENL